MVVKSIDLQKKSLFVNCLVKRFVRVMVIVYLKKINMFYFLVHL